MARFGEGWTTASGSARILKDNEGCRINILGRTPHLRLPSSPFSPYLSFALAHPAFPATRRDESELSPAAARAPDCNRNSFVNYRILRPRATSAAPSTAPNVGFAREHTLGTVVTVVHRYCPLMPGRSRAAVSCRTYSLTLDTVPSIQRHFSEALARHDRAPWIDTCFVLRSLTPKAHGTSTLMGMLASWRTYFLHSQKSSKKSW